MNRELAKSGKVFLCLNDRLPNWLPCAESLLTRRAVSSCTSRSRRPCWSRHPQTDEADRSVGKSSLWKMLFMKKNIFKFRFFDIFYTSLSQNGMKYHIFHRFTEQCLTFRTVHFRRPVRRVSSFHRRSARFHARRTDLPAAGRTSRVSSFLENLTCWEKKAHEKIRKKTENNHSQLIS